MPRLDSAAYNEWMEIRSFRDLEVWRKSMDLVEAIYELTDDFPKVEQFGLRVQLRRAAVSIASNIAEGHARRTGHYLNHLSVALGSGAELETQLELACRLRFVERHRVEPLLPASAEIGRMVHGLVSSVERNAAARAKRGGGRTP